MNQVMCNLQTVLVRNNYEIVLATLNVDGRPGTLSIKQSVVQCRTDTASVIVKLDGEKSVKQKINTMVRMEGLKDYLSEFYIDAQYVVAWKI